MLKLLSRISTVIRLSRAGRGQELDRVLTAMEDGAQFEGAAGVMLLTLADDLGCMNAWMCRSERRFIPECELGERYAEKVKKHIYDTRHAPLLQEGLPS